LLLGTYNVSESDTEIRHRTEMDFATEENKKVKSQREKERWASRSPDGERVVSN
jgi:hypothetical protein